MRLEFRPFIVLGASLVAVLAVALSGCGPGERIGRRPASVAAVKSEFPASKSAERADDSSPDRFVVDFAAQPAQGQEPPKLPTEPPRTERRIIYRADVTLVVKDFAAAEKRVLELLRQFGGYLADSQVQGSHEQRRSGRWVARVPVDRFAAFLDAVVELGFPESRRQYAQDVTEEFVDLEARIKSKQEVERRLIKLIDERTGKIEDVVKVETELGRVREEIERMQGRLRFLANQTSFSTVTIDAREEAEYVPPRAPTFPDRIALTWHNSTDSLVDFAQGVVLIAVALAPWLPAIVLFAGAIALLIRRAMRPRTATDAPP